MAIHNLLKAWEFHNRAVFQYQRMPMAQQMMNKPVRQDGIYSEHVAVLFSAAPLLQLTVCMGFKPRLQGRS
jgi:hypothetical protein